MIIAGCPSAGRTAQLPVGDAHRRPTDLLKVIFLRSSLRSWGSSTDCSRCRTRYLGRPQLARKRARDTDEAIPRGAPAQTRAPAARAPSPTVISRNQYGFGTISNIDRGQSSCEAQGQGEWRYYKPSWSRLAFSVGFTAYGLGAESRQE